MTLKTSSFKINKTILLKNVVRFWPIWVVYTIIMIFIFPVQLYTNVRNTIFFTEEDPVDVIAMSKTTDMLGVIDNVLQPVLIAIFAILAAVVVFSYLYGSRSCNMLHAFPVTRKELFATNYISGLLFVIAPQIISYIIALVVCAIFSVSDVRYLGAGILLMLGISFFFYSMAVFCCMLTGNFFAGFGIFVLFNFIYVAVESLFVCLADVLCYGFGSIYDLGGADNMPGVALSPLFYLSRSDYLGVDYDIMDLALTEVTITGGKAVGLYCIPAIIFVVLSVMLYQRRHLECAAEITAYRFVKPLVRWMVTVPAAMGLAFWFCSVFFGGSKQFLVIWILVLAVLSWAVFFVLEMLINKKFKIFKKKRFLEWAACLAVLLVITGMLEADAFGIEKRVPEISEVKGIAVSAGSDMVLVEPEEMERMLAAHQAIVDNKKEYEAYSYTDNKETAYVDLEYYLTDGTMFGRTYYIPDAAEYMADAESAAAQIRSLQEDTNAYLKEWMITNYEGVEIKEGTFHVYTEEDERLVVLTEEQANVLYEAMVKDINANNIGCYVGPEPKIGEAEMAYTNSYIELKGITTEEPIDLYTLRSSLIEDDEASIEAVTRPYYEYTEEDYFGGFLVTPEGYVIPFGFDLPLTCEYTIQALIDLEIIESVDDIIVDYKEY